VPGRGAEFTLEKIAAMEIDHAAAMERRAAVRAEIEAQRQEQRQARHRQRSETFVSVASLGRRPAAGAAGPATRPLQIAVASRGGLIDQHFGHAREFLIYEADAEEVRFIGSRRVEAYCSGHESCGDAEATLAGILRALDGCAAVLCARIGIEPWDALEAAGITPNGEHAMEPIEDAVAAVYAELAAAGRLDAPAAAAALSA
jgi:nitrogen fixation protein NifB